MPILLPHDLLERIKPPVPAGEAASIDGPGAPLRGGATHELFSAQEARCWRPPVALLSGIVSRALRMGRLDRVAWVGRAVFPYPVFLDTRARAVSVFVDPPSAEARVWALDVLLRSGARVGVVGDGCGLSIAHSRRLQIAARAGYGIGLLARSQSEESVLSAATTRWRVSPCCTGDVDRVAWTAALLRNKDQPTLAVESRCWRVEWDDAEGFIAVPALVAGRTDRPAHVAAS